MILLPLHTGDLDFRDIIPNSSTDNDNDTMTIRSMHNNNSRLLTPTTNTDNNQDTTFNGSKTNAPISERNDTFIVEDNNIEFYLHKTKFYS